ncbi:hypothetical protein L211DRAFT_854186 [Terfezia boudieri ATCC MYA-4762]|uniref:Uncharacterized protein n=1 Tax=Terfezia boudieri ATCC MYA-4762 TaxID=1051890 RepID=A0A3N4LA80_9PEZI|nr:hypothetical protein L211DRAFT_854186 [Terfezia boudieri ATCC MYA-4762]
MTLDGIWDMVKAYIPAGRKVREIIGALTDPTPSNLTFPAEYISLNTDAEMRGFFRMTKANPVCLLVILYTLPPRANIFLSGAAYFELEKFAPSTEYDDYTEDSNAIVWNATGVGRRLMPTRDHTFEERKVVSKVHGLNAAQYHWETLNGQHAPAPAPAPAPPPLPPPPPPLPQNIAADPAARIPAILRPGDAPKAFKDDQQLCPSHFRRRTKARKTRRLFYSLLILLYPLNDVQHRMEYAQQEKHTSNIVHYRLSALQHIYRVLGREGRQITHTPSSVNNALSDGLSIESNEDHNMQEEESDYMVNKPSCIGPCSRSFFKIPDEYRQLTSQAASCVCDYMLFGNLILSMSDLEKLFSVSWVKAQEDIGLNQTRLKIANAYTHEKYFRASEITEIIFCKYYVTIKMWGYTDDHFFDSINEVFICLVTSAMCHCLMVWMTGIYVEPSNTESYKYQTTITTYQRFLPTWNAYPRKVRILLLVAIKADIGTHLVSSQQKGSLESNQPLLIDDLFQKANSTSGIQVDEEHRNDEQEASDEQETDEEQQTDDK